MILTVREDVRHTPCRTCGSGSGAPCRTKRGKERESNHGERVKDHLAVLSAPLRGPVAPLPSSAERGAVRVLIAATKAALKGGGPTPHV